jgi:hypothetical protein
MKTLLEAQVEAQNIANAEANRLAAILSKNFAPLVGQQILKADGSVMEKFKHLLPKMADTNGLHNFFKSPSAYFLVFIVQSCVNYGICTCTYGKAAIYVAELEPDGKTLKAIVNFEERRTDYSVEKIVAAREKIALLKEQINEVEKEFCDSSL